MCVGSGIAIGAYSGGWFLVLAIVLAALGIAMVAGAFTRSVTAASAGELVPVTVDLIDRSAPAPAIASTLVAGEARPPRDAPFRFHRHANLSRAQIAGIVADGRGELPSEAIGTPGSAAVIEHRPTRAHAPAALTAVAAMWATMLLPPSDIWDLKPLTRSVSTAVPGITSDDPDTKPLWQWYDELLAHLRTESPDLLDALLAIDIRDSYVTATVYLGGDKSRSYEGRTRGWDTTESTTASRARDTFSIGDLQGFSAQDYVSKAMAMLPPDDNKPTRLAISREDDIFGATRPVLIDGWFGDPSVTVMGKTDGTVAPWWPADDVGAGLAQAEAALVARGLSTSEPILKEIELSDDKGGFWLSFFRGDYYYRTHASAGGFTTPDDPMGDDTWSPRFRFTDVSPTVVAQVREDAMRRYGVDPVDRGKAKITIGKWDSNGGDREGQVVIKVNYQDAHGDEAVYALSGEHLAG
ncbi:hypothetical protein A5792_12020 [Mycolicibacterium peregrinum]|uniref:Uncharacterized protein n=1 Tax=Mycolicibacterium peregrinum TaxID=43304 RepID=A0A1A0RGA6_MYCPR|nr:hypothetical protein A5792_12020 [Mycolicibacterium peregrinum]